MFSVDPYIVEFVSKNFLGLLLAREILNRVAKITPWAVDDQIYQIFTGLIDIVRRHKPSDIDLKDVEVKEDGRETL